MFINDASQIGASFYLKKEYFMNNENLKGKKMLNKFITFFNKPSNIILVVFAVLLTLTVIIPLGFLVINTFQVHIGESHLGTYGSLTFQHWANILTKASNSYALLMFWQPLLNSVLMAIVACIISVSFKN